MKNVTGLLVLVVALFCAVAVQSQVPGYLGKKLSAAIGTEMSPFTGALVKDKPVYALQPKLMASVQYVVGIDKELGVFASYRSTTTEAPEISNTGNKLPLYNDLWSVGVTYRHYGFDTHGTIAPLGGYTAYFLGYAHSSVLDDGNLLQTGTTTVGSWDSFIVGLGIGKQIIFKDKYLVDFGGRFIAAPQAYDFIGKNLDFEQVEIKDEYTRFDRRAQQNLFSNFLFAIYVEVGGIFL